MASASQSFDYVRQLLDDDILRHIADLPAPQIFSFCISWDDPPSNWTATYRLDRTEPRTLDCARYRASGYSRVADGYRILMTFIGNRFRWCQHYLGLPVYPDIRS